MLNYLVVMPNQRHRQPVTLKTLLAEQSLLSCNTLYNHLETLRQLQASLPHHIESELVKHCRIGNYKNKILTLTATSANWASRLRYSVPDILASINKQPMPVEIKSIRVVVSPDQVTDTIGQSKRKPSLSRNSAKLMQQIAASINDAELSACIRRLCRNSSLKQ